jgi:hypothetical protein
MMFRRIFLFCVLFIAVSEVKAQERLIQWTGSVKDENLAPLSFVSVVVMQSGKGTISDKNGKFTLLAHSQDTLKFSSIGYKTIRLGIPKTNSSVILYDVIMEQDTVALEEIIVLPWKTFGEFKKAFVEVTLAEDEMQRAYKNIKTLQTHLYRQIKEEFQGKPDPYASFRFSMQQQYMLMSQEGMIVPTTELTNPLAWAELVEAIRRGDFKRKN